MRRPFIHFHFVQLNGKLWTWPAQYLLRSISCRDSDWFRGRPYFCWLGYEHRVVTNFTKINTHFLSSPVSEKDFIHCALRFMHVYDLWLLLGFLNACPFMRQSLSLSQKKQKNFSSNLWYHATAVHFEFVFINFLWETIHSHCTSPRLGLLLEMKGTGFKKLV